MINSQTYKQIIACKTATHIPAEINQIGYKCMNLGKYKTNKTTGYKILRISEKNLV